MNAEKEERRDLGRYLKYFLYLGSFGFGGPIATVGYMQRDLVERRAWLSERDFLNGVALGQAMPGPLAAQVTMWVGYLQSGALGALWVSLAFILPSFLVVLAVAALYVQFEGLPWVQALFRGIAPGVMAVILIAAIRLARLTNRRDWWLWGISAIAATVTAVTGAEVALLFIAAGVLMVLVEAPPKRPRERSVGGPVLLAASLPWSNGLPLLAVSAGTQTALAIFFLKAGAFIFGSGLAIVPFLREGVVQEHHWLTEDQFLDAVAMGLITPGPVVITATFIGYLVGGFLGAIVATVAIFAPIYLGVVVPGPWFIRHAEHPRLRAFVKGATAAAAGAIAGAWFLLTREVLTNVPPGALDLQVELFRDVVLDVPAVLIFLISLVLLWRFKLKEPLLVLGCALVGLAVYL